MPERQRVGRWLAAFVVVAAVCLGPTPAQAQIACGSVTPAQLMCGSTAGSGTKARRSRLPAPLRRLAEATGAMAHSATGARRVAAPTSAVLTSNHRSPHSMCNVMQAAAGALGMFARADPGTSSCSGGLNRKAPPF